MDRRGFIYWDRTASAGRKPSLMTREYPLVFQLAGLHGGPRTTPAQYARWFLELLMVPSANTRMADNWFPIHHACDSNFLTCQPYIIAGLLSDTTVAVLNERTMGNRPPFFSPLMLLCDGSNRTMTTSTLCQMLVRARADIESQDYHRNTPFPVSYTHLTLPTNRCV